MVAVFRGRFYEFHRSRVISRPGEPLVTRGDIEIGPEISREYALKRVLAGKDVYTPAKQDAYRLATQAQNDRPPLQEVHGSQNSFSDGANRRLFSSLPPWWCASY